MLTEILLAGRQASLKIWPMTPSFCFGGAFLVWNACAPPNQQWQLTQYLEKGFSPREAAFDPYLAEESRRGTERLIRTRFPGTLPQLERLGCDHGRLLKKKIVAPLDALEWANSYWNGATPWFTEPEKAPHFDEQDLEVICWATMNDSEGKVTVKLLEDRRVLVLWGEPDSPMAGRVGDTLGPRHPVSLRAHGRGKGKISQ